MVVTLSANAYVHILLQLNLAPFYFHPPFSKGGDGESSSNHSHAPPYAPLVNERWLDMWVLLAGADGSI
jgi:hypothetical protein